MMMVGLVVVEVPPGVRRLVSPEQRVVQRHSFHACQFGGVAETQHGSQLGFGSHKACARPEVENVDMEVKENLARLVGDAKRRCVTLS